MVRRDEASMTARRALGNVGPPQLAQLRYAELPVHQASSVAASTRRFWPLRRWMPGRPAYVSPASPSLSARPAYIRGHRSVPRESVWIDVISLASSLSCIARGDPNVSGVRAPSGPLCGRDVFAWASLAVC